MKIFLPGKVGFLEAQVEAVAVLKITIEEGHHPQVKADLVIRITIIKRTIRVILTVQILLVQQFTANLTIMTAIITGTGIEILQDTEDLQHVSIVAVAVLTIVTPSPPTMTIVVEVIINTMEDLITQDMTMPITEAIINIIEATGEVQVEVDIVTIIIKALGDMKNIIMIQEEVQVMIPSIDLIMTMGQGFKIKI